MTYYYGSYGLVRGYGPLTTSIRMADWTVRDDDKRQRLTGGSSDRYAVVVDPQTGLCWRLDGDEDDFDSRHLEPVRTTSGVQASYPGETIRLFERARFGPSELAGFS